jgi:pilus assembly protein Flp/PilA
MRMLNDALLWTMATFHAWKPRTSDEKGQTLVEYALIVGLVSIAAILVMIVMGTAIGGVFTKITDKLDLVTL